MDWPAFIVMVLKLYLACMGLALFFAIRRPDPELED